MYPITQELPVLEIQQAAIRSSEVRRRGVVGKLV
jgi:hypothetical protein